MIDLILSTTSFRQEFEMKTDYRANPSEGILKLAELLKTKNILLFIDDIQQLGVLKLTDIPVTDENRSFLVEMYYVWTHIFMPFVENGGLIAAGRGTFLSSLGTGKIKEKVNSPCKVQQIALKSFTAGNILEAMKNTRTLTPLYQFLKSNCDTILQQFAEWVAHMTGGIAHFVERVLSKTNDKKGLFSKVTNTTEVTQILRDIMNETETPIYFTNFFTYSANPIQKSLYALAFYLAAFEIEITEGETIPLPNEILKKAFPAFKCVSVSDLVNELYCYLVPVVPEKRNMMGEQFLKIVFPPLIFDRYLKEMIQHEDLMIPIFTEAIRNGTKEIISAGNLLEHMVNVITKLKINFNVESNKTFGQVFQFLENSFIGNVKITKKLGMNAFRIPKIYKDKNYELRGKEGESPESLNKRVQEKIDDEFIEIEGTPEDCISAVSTLHKDNWYALLEKCPDDQILVPKPESSSPDSFLLINRYETLLSFQPKNTLLSKTMLKQEIQKTGFILDSIKTGLAFESNITEKGEEIPAKRYQIALNYSNLKITLVVVALELDNELTNMISNNASLIMRKSPDFEIPENLEVILLHPKQGLESFLHKWNVGILHEFRKNKDNINLTSNLNQFWNSWNEKEQGLNSHFIIFIILFLIFY